MIIQIKGKVKFPITLDPTVWIFDDRKILLKEAFNTNKAQPKKQNEAEKMAEMFDIEVYSQTKIKPPVNKSVKRFDREQLLSESYVMPLKSFIENAEINDNASVARLISEDGEVIITIQQLLDGLALFSINGKPIIENGPIHFFFSDGSNQDDPFKGIKQIIIE